MTSFQRQVRRRDKKALAQEKLLKLMQAAQNFEMVAAPTVSRESLIRDGLKRHTGDYSPLPNPRKDKRLVVRTARKFNRG